ncbi:MAG TPA: serine/threonine-protein kinase [Polyangiaceae bacterium]|nr:serine/threonine-protein kinase [Polyangiaceae bacterium]
MTSPGKVSPTIPAPPAKSLVGKVLSERYRIEALLGEGGMGAVYLAEHVLMHKRLAVKVLHPEMTRMPEIVARFEREAMAAAHIEHPNVAAATDFGKLDDGAFFLVLEYIEGTNLRDLIAKGPLPSDDALHIAYQIGSALLRAHALGIVHRDLKPENVMLVERDGDTQFVKVLDFGIAKVPVGELSRRDASAPSGQVLTQLGMVYGTPEYMAPEQALGQEVDARADLYGLGVILFEMLAGVRPFEAESKVALLGMKVTSDPPSMASKNPDVCVSPALEAIVKRLLDKEASARFQDARELLEAIESSNIGTLRTEHRRPGLPTPAFAQSSARRASAALASSPDVVERAPFDLASKVREFTAHVPIVVVAAGVGLVLLLALVFGVASFTASGPSASGSASGIAANPDPPLFKKLLAPATAPADALGAATQTGVAALEDLSSRFPKDAAVWRALVRAYSKEKRGVDAMRAVAKLVEANERAVDDDEIQGAVASAAQGAVESADAAFDLMENGLGSKGPDFLYELSTTKGISQRTSARIKQVLAKPDVRARMSPALAVAFDLKNSSGCESKRALLGRAKEQGDARSLAGLRTLQAAKGCGFLGLGDCWSCMRRDNALGAAIAAIEDRTGK